MVPGLEQVRRQSIPIIYVRGSYYEVGYDIGRTFGSIIQSYVNTANELNDVLPLYETAQGKAMYDCVLENCKKNYPNYIEELKGTAEGSKVPFHKLFLLHLADILPNRLQKSRISNKDQGCSTVCVNEVGQELIGHTEDGLKDVLNHIYIVNAHITEFEPHEKFTALCYAGLLPGYSMGFNVHGLVFSINIIHAKYLNEKGIPRSFIARALLSADTFQKVENILQCKDYGIADAMSVNFTFLYQKGDRLFHNIEVSPNYPANNESCMSTLTTSPGEQIFHCNKLIHLVIPEDDTYQESSITRHKTKDAYGEISQKSDVINLLGDTSHPVHNIFRDGNLEILTVAVAIFDILNKTWSVYINNPKTSDPLVTLPLEMK